MLTFLPQVKKSLPWICVAVFLCLVVVWKMNPSATYQFAKDQVRMSISNDGSNAEPNTFDCEEETACRMKVLHRRINEVCLIDKNVRHSLAKKEYSGLLNHKHKLLYFSIPKVGCSFWKRIFKVLNSKNNETKMFDIPNYKAHYGQGLVRAQTRRQVDMYLPSYTSFLFVRDPFSRLFSGYIDKMFVPNPIALNHGSVFFRKYRSGESSKEEDCELNISFADFAMYMSDRIINNRMTDGHFIPMWKHLNPCDVNLTYIAKMEHFMDDTNYILSSVGLTLDDVSGTADNASFNEMHEKGYMEDIINRTFKYTKIRKPCLGPKKVLQRLWTTFYIRGYLSKSQKMPNFKRPDKVTAEDFVSATSRAYDLSGSKSERSAQRREAMMEAYSSVPRMTLIKLAKAFDMDCRVFDYSCDVNERFPVRYSAQPFYFQS